MQERLKKYSKFFTLRNVVLAVIFIVCAGIIGFYATTGSIDVVTNDPSMATKVYFVNASTGNIEAEERVLPTSEPTEIVSAVLGYMIEGPRNKALNKLFPPELEILNAPRIVNSNNSSIFEIEFSKAYYNMPPQQEALFRLAFVWTMTELKFIEQVHIYIDGTELTNSRSEPMGLLSRANNSINPPISPFKTQSREVVLYFADETRESLIRENRMIVVNADKPIEQFIVEALIAGPKNESCYPTMPPETKVRAVHTDEGICYVNLSNDFLTKNPAVAIPERTTIYSIVNSLTELTSVKKVQFLIESENVTSFRGTMDLSKPFERDEAITIQ